MFKLAKWGLVAVGVFALMYLFGSGQMESFVAFVQSFFA